MRARLPAARGLLALLALACAARVASAFGFGGGAGGGSLSVPDTAAVKSDVKYIKCEVCNLLAKQAYRQVKAAEKALKPGKKMSEYAIIELLEKITDPLKDEGEWVAHIDLVEEGSRLAVREQGGLGKCGSECKTVQRAAEGLLDGIDTDMAEQLWKGSLSRAQFANWLCQQATPACRGKPPALPADRPPGPAFEELDPEEAKMQKMMAQMKEMGMGGQMFSRDQAQRMADGGSAGEDYDEYGDDSNPSEGEGGGPPGFGGAGAAAGAADESADDSAGGVWDTLSSLGQDAADAASEAVKMGGEFARRGGELAGGLLAKAQGLLPGGGGAASEQAGEL